MNAEKSFIVHSSFDNVEMNHTSMNYSVLYDNRFNKVSTDDMLMVESKSDLDPVLFRKSRVVDLKNISKEN